jgi:CRP-like cAMP-binding protein
MYIIHKGLVQLVYENETSKYQDFEYKLCVEEIKINENFGDSEVLARCRRITSAVTKTDCQLYKLSQFNLDKIMYDYPKIKMHMVRMAVKNNQ